MVPDTDIDEELMQFITSKDKSQRFGFKLKDEQWQLEIKYALIHESHGMYQFWKVIFIPATGANYTGVDGRIIEANVRCRRFEIKSGRWQTYKERMDDDKMDTSEWRWNLVMLNETHLFNDEVNEEV